MNDRYIYIETKNEQSRIEALQVLFGLGFVWHKGKDEEHSDPKNVINKYPNYPVTRVDMDKKSLNGIMYAKKGEGLCWEKSAAKIISLVINRKKPIEIKDVGIYTAVVSESGVEVGCQNISFDKVREIYEAVKKFEQ